ncbi:MAG: sensor histidine kinase [Gammaproteobacteria bacterium]
MPVVDGDKPVGVISRYQIMQVMFKLYGREIFGRKPVTELMNPAPVVIEATTDLTTATSYITERLQFPVTEDFVIVQDGRYLGVGIVLRLLQSVSQQLTQQSRELSKTNTELKSSQTQLIQSEKMASLGQMVAGVAHEINTPLGYVRNNVEMLEQFLDGARQLACAAGELTEQMLSPQIGEPSLQASLSELMRLRDETDAEDRGGDMRKLIGDTRFGINQISELVINLKNFSRLDRAASDDVNINECLESALLLARHVLKNRITVVKQFVDLPLISCAPSQLNQVFLNLITNAVQAIEGEGRILIRTEHDVNELRIIVQDSGKGIPADVLPRIFDPFFTTKPVGKGTGLGLSISYQIVQQHGGDIRALSEPGKGTRFIINLPLKSGTAGEQVPATDNAEGEDRGQERDSAVR